MVLKKQLSLFSLFSLAFGTIVGVGWITVLGAWLTAAGSAGAALGFLLGGVLMLFVALCYCEVATLYPVSGGEVAYIYKMYGPRASFVAGWYLAFFYIAVTSFEAISVGWVLQALIPGFDGPVVYRIFGEDVHAFSLMVGLGLMGVITAVNYLGSRYAALLQNVMVGALLLAILVFAASGAFRGDAHNLEPLFVGGDGVAAAYGVLSIVASAPFWYAGFDTIPQAMGELKQGAALKKLSHVIIAAIGTSMLFYCVVILVASLTAPREALLSAELPIAEALENAFASKLMRDVVLIAGLCGLISTWNAIFFAATRVIYVLGRARFLPSGFSRVSAKHGVPGRAIVFVGVLGGLGTLFGKTAIVFIVSISALILSTLFVAIVVGAMRLRVQLPNIDRPFLMPFGKVGLWISFVSALTVFGLAFREAMPAPGVILSPHWRVIITWFLIGLFFWLISARQRSSISDAEREALIMSD